MFQVKGFRFFMRRSLQNLQPATPVKEEIVVLNGPALVLNRNWVPIHVTSVVNALCKLYDGSARAVKADDYSVHDFDSWVQLGVEKDAPRIRTATLEIAVPEVIVLAKYEKIPERKVAFSRANLYKR